MLLLGTPCPGQGGQDIPRLGSPALAFGGWLGIEAVPLCVSGSAAEALEARSLGRLVSKLEPHRAASGVCCRAGAAQLFVSLASAFSGTPPLVGAFSTPCSSSLPLGGCAACAGATVTWIELGRGGSSGDSSAIGKERSRQRRLTVKLLAR